MPAMFASNACAVQIFEVALSCRMCCSLRCANNIGLDFSTNLDDSTTRAILKKIHRSTSSNDDSHSSNITPSRDDSADFFFARIGRTILPKLEKALFVVCSEENLKSAGKQETLLCIYTIELFLQYSFHRVSSKK